MNKDIEMCDKAPTGKAKCFSCRRSITKGTPRLWYHDTLCKEINKISGMTVKRLICHRCSIDVMNYEISRKKRELSKSLMLRRKFVRKMKGQRIKETILKEKILEGLEEPEQKGYLLKNNSFAKLTGFVNVLIGMAVASVAIEFSNV